MSSLRGKSISAQRKETVNKLTKNSPRPPIRFFYASAGKISEGTSQGSLTVEAALVLTIFLLAVTCLWGIFPAMQIGLEIQAAIEETGEEMAAALGVAQMFPDAGAALEGADMGTVRDLLAGGLTLAALKERVVGKVGRERLTASCVCGGSGGISLLGSSWMKEGERVDIQVTYRIRLPFPIGSLAEFSVTQNSSRRAWTGRLADAAGAGGEEELVYVTENGSVYHSSMNCTHLNLSISEISSGSVGIRRNEGGGRYHPCERCAKYTEIPAVVWITREGNRYHTDRSCGGLKRSVETKRKAEVNLPPCSRCSGAGS